MEFSLCNQSSLFFAHHTNTCSPKPANAIKRSVNSARSGPLFCRHSSKLLLLGASGWLFCVSFCLPFVCCALIPHANRRTATLALHHARQFASSVMPHFGRSPVRSKGKEDKPYGWSEQVLHDFRFFTRYFIQLALHFQDQGYCFAKVANALVVVAYSAIRSFCSTDAICIRS